MFGGGASLAYTPSLVILGHYFQRWMGLVNGFVTAGSSVFTIALPFILPYILDIGIQTTFQVLAGITAFLMVSAGRRAGAQGRGAGPGERRCLSES